MTGPRYCIFAVFDLKSEKSMLAVTVNCEFSLPLLNINAGENSTGYISGLKITSATVITKTV